MSRLFALCVVFILGFALLAEANEPISLDSLPAYYEDIRNRKDFWIPETIYQQIGRQAVLLTAREEFGLPTRDIVLGEPLDRESPETFMLNMEVRAAQTPIKLTLTRGDKTVFENEFFVKVPPTVGYKNLTEVIGPMTRNELKQAFVDLGFEPRPAKWVDSAPLTDEVERLLNEMNDISQWQALRIIHAEMRESGESPERLAGIVRAYSNLSALTDCTLDLQYTVYAGRALLYAERLVAKQPDDFSARWPRIYTYIMTGMVNLANEEIEAMQNEVGEGGDLEMPEWGELMKAYIRYRYDVIEPIAFDEDDSRSELATLLWFRIMSQFRARPLSIVAGQKALSNNPESLCVLDVMFQEAGVSLNHQITAQGPAMLSQFVAHQLPNVADLPADIESKFNDADYRPSPGEMAEIAHQLTVAGADDKLEPSLAVLGRGIESWNVLHAMRRGQFVASYLGASADDEREYAEEVIAHHPNAPLVRLWYLPLPTTASDQKEVLKGFKLERVNPKTGYYCLSRLLDEVKIGDETKAEVLARIWTQINDTENYLIWICRYTGPTANIANKMNRSSAHSPIRFESQLLAHFKGSRKQLDKWFEEYDYYPSLHRAAATGFAAAGENDEAIEHYVKYLAIVPDPDILKKLAEVYYQVDRFDDCQETLEKIFDTQDFGLSHSYAASTIAANWMHQGNFEKALEWASRGAESGAAPPMMVHAECLTALGQLDEAEQTMAYLARRYRMTADWYEWCYRTGKGHYEQAWAIHSATLKANAANDPRSAEVAETLHAIYEGDKAAARRSLEQRLANKFSPFDTMFLGLLHDEAGNTEERDRRWKELVDFDWSTDPDGKSGYAFLAEYLLELDGSTDFADADYLKLCTEIEAQIGTGWRPAIDFAMAKYLQNHDDKQRAIELYKPSAGAGQQFWGRMLAWHYLRELDVDASQLKGRYFPTQFYKPAPTK